MRKSIAIGFLLLFAGPVATSLAGEKEPARQILALRLSMHGEEAHARLKEIGNFVRSVDRGQEVWKVRDPSYSNILLGFNKDDQLRYITAVARTDKDAKPVPYTSVGDLTQAKQVGNPKIKVYNYQWELPPEKDEPETLVVALGRDPNNLSTYSLKRLGAGGAAEDND